MEEGFGGGGSTTGNLHDYFAFKIQQNVHVAMIMNTGHQKFASRILSNPSLYKRCNIVCKLYQLLYAFNSKKSKIVAFHDSLVTIPSDSGLLELVL